MARVRRTDLPGARRGGTSGPFGAVATLSGADDRAVSPRIVVTSEGAILARSVRLSGRLGRRRTLTAPRERGHGLSLAVGPRSDALAAWATSGRLRAAHRPG